MYKVGVCLIIKDENQYLEEWVKYYREVLKVDGIFIYDNESSIPVTSLGGVFLKDNNISVKVWKDNQIGSQMRAYLDCCRENQNYDYIAFVDTDEFIIVKNGQSLGMFLFFLEKEIGKFDGLGMSWRFYGSNPYFTRHKKMESYVQYHENGHIKSIVNPKKVVTFKDPHFATLILRSRYVNELGDAINSPICTHTSEKIWVKHIYTRSEQEWKEKIVRGSGDKVFRKKSMNDFFEYNLKCILHD